MSQQEKSSTTSSETSQGYVNLGYKPKERFLENTYIGKSIKATGLIDKPIKIGKWELKPSKFHEGKECLYAQIGFIGENGQPELRLLVTESRDLIQALKEMMLKKNGDLKKIIYTSLKMDSTGKISPVKLLKDEIDSLKSVYLD